MQSKAPSDKLRVALLPGRVGFYSEKINLLASCFYQNYAVSFF
jgi:hypothetical protein